MASSLSIAALRLTFASLILAPFVLAATASSCEPSRVATFCSPPLRPVLAVHFGTWITSLEYTTVASSVVLVSTRPPVGRAALASLVGRTHIPRGVLGVLLALLGGLVIGRRWRLHLGSGLSCRPLAEILREDLWAISSPSSGLWPSVDISSSAVDFVQRSIWCPMCSSSTAGLLCSTDSPLCKR